MEDIRCPQRLYRLLVNAQAHTDRFLVDFIVLGIIDSIGIELIHPRREGRSDDPLGKKGISNHRWIVGIKLAWLINQRGEVVQWPWLPANVSDQEFRDLVDWQEVQTMLSPPLHSLLADKLLCTLVGINAPDFRQLPPALRFRRPSG